MIRERIRERLARLEPRRIDRNCAREAAVLVPVFERGGEPHLLLTLRTDEVETHKGQVSFPGGMREGSESLETTALRETFEEVGIDPAGIEMLGRYHEYLAITEARVTPFVGFLETPFTANAHPDEVAEILEVPFSVFRDPSRLRIQPMERLGRTIDVLFFSFGKHEIWGLTARIIQDLLDDLDRSDASAPT